MKTRVFHTKYWYDSYVYSLKSKEKLFYLYFFTNDRIGLICIYEIPDNMIIQQLAITQKELDKLKDKFQSDCKLIFYKNYVMIPNVIKYQSYTGEKNEIARHKEILSTPDNIHLYFENYCNDTLSIQYPYSIDTASNKKSKISNKKLVISNKKLEILIKQLEIINNKSELKKYKPRKYDYNTTNDYLEALKIYHIREKELDVEMNF
jgi:hypothetical protein